MNFRRLLFVPMLVMTLVASVLTGTALGAETGEPVDYRLTFPVDGPHYFSDTFWAGRSHGFHVGQDMLADKMVPVVAVADGVVRLINWTDNASMNPDRCCALVLRHDDGWESWYIHLNNDTPGTDDGKGWGIEDGIVPGTRVKAGQHIGWIGDSGNAENVAPQLHYELRDPSGTIVNPYRSLVAAGGNDVGTGDRDPLVGGARLLTVGTSGYDIRILQQTLSNLGYSVGTIDGQFGPATEAAVKAFQAAFGIQADGRVGRTTKTALAGLSFSDSSGDVLSVGSTGENVVELQHLLNEKGYDAGASDGVFGATTLKAVITFQKAEKLWVDGLVGSKTLKALKAAPKASVPEEDHADEASDETSETTTAAVVDESHSDATGTLSVGARGPEVEEFQKLLTGKGYDPGPSDGIFGENTRLALIAFQAIEGLTVDGIVGPATMAALGGAPESGGNASVGADILSLGSRGTEVAEIQFHLVEEGYAVGAKDGIFGPLTHAALVEFQKDHKLVPDGKVGPRTRGALGIL